MRVYKVTLLVNRKVITEEFESEDNVSAYNKAKSMNGFFLQLELMPINYKLQEASQ